MKYNINHAGNSVSFQTDTILDDYLRECVDNAIKSYYCHFLPSSSDKILISYILTDHIQDFFHNEEQSIISETAKINSNQVLISGHGNTFAYEFENGILNKIYYNIVNPGHIKNIKNKLTSRSFSSNVEAQIASMYSRGFLHGMQIKNLHEGASFLHACSFAIDDNAYVMSATPGAGKSSLLLALAFNTEINAKFISDDFACIDKNGYAHEIGRSIAIKSHQIQYFPELQKVLKNMNVFQKLQWFILHKKGLKFMASPEEIFPGRITTNKHVKKIFYLTNHNKSTFEYAPMTNADYADLNANMLFSELFLGMEIINRALILPGYTNVPTADKFIAQTRMNLCSIFDNTPCFLIKVPFRSDPRQLLNFMLLNNLIEL